MKYTDFEEKLIETYDNSTLNLQMEFYFEATSK